MATINSIDSNIPIEISKGGTNATTMATSNGTVIYDGTRLVTSAVGTAGQVLTSNGASAPTYQNQIFTKTITLTSAQVKSILGTPITIVPAAGANTVITPFMVTSKFIYGGSNPFTTTAGQVIQFKYASPIGTSAFSNIIINSELTGTSSGYRVSTPGTTGVILKANGLIDNVPLVFGNNSNTDEIAGNAANDNSIIFYITYYIATLV